MRLMACAVSCFFGIKVTFVDGKLDTVREIERVRSLATEIQARLIVADDVLASNWKDALSVLDSAGSDKKGRTEHRGD